MKKSLGVTALWAIILIIVVLIIAFRKDDSWDVMDWPWMINEVSSYSVRVEERDEYPWEDVYVYNEKWRLALSLEDKNQPQYLFALYGNYIVLDSGTSASMREFLVYDIPSWKLVYRTDYFPWEYWLVLDGDNMTFYKKIPESLLWEYTLPQCEGEYDNGYIENYGYRIWEDQANDLGDIQCAYFE